MQTTGYGFSSNCDSEIVLALYEEHGTSFLHYLKGEFALYLYDSRKRLFIAARDRYGVTPLLARPLAISSLSLPRSNLLRPPNLLKKPHAVITILLSMSQIQEKTKTKTVVDTRTYLSATKASIKVREVLLLFD